MRLIPDNKDFGWTPYLWLIYLVPFLAYPLGPGHTLGEIGAMFAGAAAFLALYFRGYWVRGRELALVIVALTILGLIFTPFNLGAPAFFIYAASFAGSLGGMRRALMVVGLVILALVAEALILNLSPSRWWWAIVFAVIVGAVNAHYSQVHRANSRLRMAQDEIEHLAKVAERERIARDLHDLLGHTLSLIILKSELASKLAERDALRARDEIRDVERISREALAEVRAAVRGYRAGGLLPELTNARQTLETAGVTVDSSTEPIQLAPVQEAVLALAVREATTNILRHAQAHKVSIRLVRDGAICRLTIVDDGRGGNSADGWGLAGMRERVESLGGTVKREGARGTTLTIELPVPGGEPASLAALGRGA
jgi:two-component system, NarL family, sensor histidine kinase DesK